MRKSAHPSEMFLASIASSCMILGWNSLRATLVLAPRVQAPRSGLSAIQHLRTMLRVRSRHEAIVYLSISILNSTDRDS